MLIRMRNMNKGVLYAIITAVLFSMLEPVSKLIADEISPFTLTAFRFLIGAVFLAPFAFAESRRRMPQKKELAAAALTGVLMVCVSMPLLQISVQRSDSPALIAIVFSGNSLFTIILSALVLKEKLRLPHMLAILLCVAGIVVCALPIEGKRFLPVGMAVLSALAFSLYTILSKKFLSRLNNAVSITLSFLIGGAALLIILIAAGQPFPSALTSRQLLCVLFLGIAVTGVGYLSYFQAMKLGRAHTAAFAFFIKPVLAPLMAYLIGGSAVTLNALLAIPLIVAGSAINAARGGKQPPVSGTPKGAPGINGPDAL